MTKKSSKVKGKAARDKDRAGPWSDYWRSGSRDACSLGATGVQAAVMSEDWKAYFAAIEGKALVLDVGTGNGTLAELAAEAFVESGHSAEILGIDAAHIHPDEALGKDLPGTISLELKGEVGAEDIPAEAGSFTHIVAQYALEYSNIRKSIPEIFRVLQSGGETRFLIHSHDSKVIENASEDLSALAELLDDMALIRRARRVFKARDLRQKPSTKASVADAKMEEVLTKLQARVSEGNVSEHHDYFLRTMTDLFGRRLGTSPAQYLEFLDQLSAEMSSYRLRLSQMQEAAKDEAGLKSLTSHMEAAGFSDITHDKQQSEATIFGWLLTARKG